MGKQISNTLLPQTDSRKEQILEAARLLFNRQGYHKTSVDDIAGAIGMTKSSLYYYFKNKEGLFFDAFRTEWKQQMKNLYETANNEEAPDKKIQTFNRESIRYYECVVVKNKIPVKVLVETRNLFRKFINEMNEERVAFFTRNLNEGIEQGIFKACDTHKIAHTIFTVKYAMQYDMLTGFLNAYPTEDDFKRMESEIMYALELILDGIRAQ